MELNFHPHKDLMLEALQYLNLKGGERSLDNARANLESLYATEASKALFAERFSAIRALADVIAQEYTPDQKELEFFFHPFSQGQGNLAELLILSFHDHTITDWQIQRENIFKKFEDFAHDPAASLQTLRVGLIQDDSSTETDPPDRPLLKQLEETGFTDGEKWQIFRIIQDTQPYLARLERLLSPVAEIIGRNLPFLQPLLDDFVRRWKAYFETKPLLTFLTENIGVNLGDISNFPVHIYPAIFEIDAIRLGMEIGGKQEPGLCLFMGLCIPEGIDVKALPMDDSSGLLEGLKALSDKSKLTILAFIRDKRSYNQELARETGLSAATISHHMSALVSCGFIRMERVDTRLYYQLNKDTLRRFLQKLSTHLLGSEN
jgi:DNA-binding transcriptional ArsR family regulator